MKVLHFSNSDLGGGAAKVAFRTHRALVEAGVQSRMMVLDRQSRDPVVMRAVGAGRLGKLRFHAGRWGALLADLACHPGYNFTLDLLGVAEQAWSEAVAEADVVHLHFTSRLLSLSQIRRIATIYHKPLVFSLMDFAAFTGGCHYPGDCTRWASRCGPCPVLSSDRPNWLAHWGWDRRRKAYAGQSPMILSPSQWAAERVAGHSLAAGFKVDILPLPVDSGLFRHIPSAAARAVLDLPDDELVVLCLAADFNDRRKGLDILVDGLTQLWHLTGGTGRVAGRKVRLLTAGALDFVAELGLPWPHRHLGLLSEERLVALLYQAADLFVSTSREDIGPLTVVEAMMCGTPVVSTLCGHAPDLIDSSCGWLAPIDCPDLLGEVMLSALSSPSLPMMGTLARERTMARHGYKAVAERLLGIYGSLRAIR